MKRYLYIILILLLGFACRKKEYPKSVEENEPVFFSKATINGEPVNFTAGQNDYQVYSSYARDEDSIYNFIADLKKNNCTGASCPSSLRIQINDYRTSSALQSVKIDSSLKSGRYDYLEDQASPHYSVTFPSDYNKTANSYRWDFGDGTGSSEPIGKHTYKKAGTYTVSLEVQGEGGCVASSFNVIRVGPNDPLNAYVKLRNRNNNWGAFEAVVIGGKQNPTYFWSFGDGTYSTLASPTHTYAVKGSYPVELRVVDGNETVVTRYNFVTVNDLSSCAANYSVSIAEIPAARSLSKIAISWTDANGVVYKSSRDPQPGASYFEIVSVENYENNENNQPTKKLKVRFKCEVYNGTKAVMIDDAEAVICVAYKQ